MASRQRPTIHVKLFQESPCTVGAFLVYFFSSTNRTEKHIMAISPITALTNQPDNALHVDTFIDYVESYIDTEIKLKTVNEFWSNTGKGDSITVVVPCPHPCVSYIRAAIFQLELTYRAVGWSRVTMITSNIHHAEEDKENFVMNICLTTL